MKKLWILITICLFIPLSSTAAESVPKTKDFFKADHLQVRLIAPSSNLSGEFQLGVHFKIDPEWHIYWKNPGDSGASPKFDVSGAELQSVKWPYPVRLPVSDLTNYGYDHEIVIPLNLTSSQPDMSLDLEWLVCKVECVPGFAEFKILNNTVTVDASLFDKYHSRVPKMNSEWKFKFLNRVDGRLEFEISADATRIAQVKNLFVYPENGETFLTQLPLTEPLEDRIKIAVPFSKNAAFANQTEAFTFVLHQADGSVDAFTENIPVQKQPPSVWMGLFLAFIGGMILNLMPCVFPILFLKAFSFLKEENSAAVRRSSWQYAAGVVVSFLVFGGLLTALRLSGEAIGWGYQLQKPWVVYVLALLFFAMALNFYGFFEMGNRLMMQASNMGSSKYLSGSFGTGILAVIVASPCTAPFMGSALGLALLLPTHLSILIFVWLGLGMALPMVVLAYVPRLIEKIPRSGQWMVTVKQFMSFPLFATCLWLLWVLGNQKGSEAIFISLVSFLIFVMGLWILNISSKKNWTLVASLLLIAAPLCAIYLIRQTSLPATTVEAKSLWVSYDEKIIADNKTVRPIFIDFTAAWCITCQVNKKTVLHADEMQTLFKEHNVLLVRADWTNQDPVITQALARFDRNSVPLYVFYNKINSAQILPEILTKDMIRNLFKPSNSQKGDSK